MQVAGGGAFGAGWAREELAGLSEAKVPVRQITKGPSHHWFGYYDKLEFDPTNRFVLSNQVGFEHRTPKADDEIKVGFVDLEEGDRWTELGSSRAWGWQQGCMLQWRPGSASEVIWNDREGDQFVSRIIDVRTGKTRTLPKPVYALSPDGKWAVTTDFARLQNMRPGYGYVGLKDRYRKGKAPEESGIWRMNLETGESELIVSLASLARVPYRGKPLTDQWNYTNHLLVSPDSRRFIFLHRWRKLGPDDAEFKTNNGFTTRMFTANLDGTDRYVLDPSGRTSHFIWKDAASVCAWTVPTGQPAGFYLFKDQTREIVRVGEGVMKRNGHNTYLPIGENQEWILNDTYPQGGKRQQTSYLYHEPSNKRYDLGHFHLPPKYTGEWRCDTHPRSSNDGEKVVIDSPHGGEGRQLWLLDVAEIVRG
jgi:hypothetical protein